MINIKQYGRIESTIEPKSIDIDDLSVWIAENIEKIEKDGMTLYQYDLAQYSKNEYIIELSNRDKVKSDALLELSSMMAEIIERNEVNG